MDSTKIILTPVDAVLNLELGEDDEDVLNEVCVWKTHRRFLPLNRISQLALSSNNKTLAFSSDSGTVGVVDIFTRNITRMKVKHNSVRP